MARESHICDREHRKSWKSQGFAIRNDKNQPYYAIVQCVTFKNDILGEGDVSRNKHHNSPKRRKERPYLLLLSALTHWPTCSMSRTDYEGPHPPLHHSSAANSFLCTTTIWHHCIERLAKEIFFHLYRDFPWTLQPFHLLALRGVAKSRSSPRVMRKQAFMHPVAWRGKSGTSYQNLKPHTTDHKHTPKTETSRKKR